MASINSLDFILNEQGTHLEVLAKEHHVLTYLTRIGLWLLWGE